MRTRTILSTTLTLICLAFFLGCQSGTEVTEPLDRPDLSELNTSAFAVVDEEDAYANVEDGTLSAEMVMNPADTGGEFVRHWRHRGGPCSHLGPILRELQPGQNQIRAIREFVREHRERVRDALEGIRRVNLDTLRAANEERLEIRERYEAGEITREEAFELLRELGDRTREAIRSNPENEPYLRMICASRGQLFADIRSVLGPNQQADWDDWVATLDCPCV